MHARLPLRPLLLAAALLLCRPASAQILADAQRAISVTGDAEIKVVPDTVLLFLGVETRDRSLAAARDLNDQRVRAVLDASRRHGIASGDTQTGFVQVEMSYNSNNHTIVDYYNVRKSIVLTLRSVAEFERVLSDMLDAGANHLHGVEFQTSELRKYRDEARALAVKAATEKARDMAAAANLKLGPATSISAWNYGSRSWYGSGWWGQRYGQMAQNVVQNAGSAAPEGTVALGRISVTAQVSMSFRLE
jgi:uncharacterized protein